MTAIAIKSSNHKKRAELADLIIKGHCSGVIDDSEHWLLQESDKTIFACALGAAMIGKFGDFDNARNAFYRAGGNEGKLPRDNVRAIAMCLDNHRTLCDEVNTLHMNGVCAGDIVLALRAA